MPSAATLGADLRALRRARGLTLEEMARRIGRSVGWLSQVERDISSPDATDLKRIADFLGVPMSIFFGTSPAPEEEAGLIVRAAHRRHIGQRSGGLIEALLSPDLTDDFEVIHSRFMPGAERRVSLSRPTRELACMISGKLDIWIDERPFTVAAGDSFRIRGQSLRWANPYPEPAVAIWVIAPPVY